MNKRQKEVQQEFLDREKAVLKKLEENYRDALGEINSKIELLMGRQDADMQHVIYQVEYQKALKTQVQAILEQLQTNEFETVSEYLSHAYEDGFIGTMYDMQGQGIPLIFPIDQQAVVDAIQADTKLSEGLYTAMGKDITDLKKKITGEISRGLSTGMMYSEITRNIASWARIPKNNAVRIARTEAHRIQCKAAMDAQHKAKAKGADVVKQWDASLDKRTRDSHRQVDGEVRELDDKFSNGLMYPGDSNGTASEVINCRCALLQRARWALGNDYTKWSPDAPVTYSDDGTVQLAIIEAKDYSEFQKKYKQASERVRSNAQKMNDEDVLEKNGKSKYNVPKGADLSDWKPKLINTTPEQDVILANINYKKGTLYEENCQRCVPAYEMRRRGYDVTAKPRIDGKDDVADAWRDIFEEAKWVPCDKGNGLSQIESLMKKYGDGARAEVYVCLDAQNAHVFVAEQRNGKTMFIDPQDGRRDARDYFNYVVDGKTELCRIDELEPSELIKECCEVIEYD